MILCYVGSTFSEWPAADSRLNSADSQIIVTNIPYIRIYTYRIYIYIHCGESPKERDHLEDQGVGGKMGWGVWIGFDWLRTGTGGGLL
jgi:hypothetical protein